MVYIVQACDVSNSLRPWLASSQFMQVFYQRGPVRHASQVLHKGSGSILLHGLLPPESKCITYRHEIQPNTFVRKRIGIGLAGGCRYTSLQAEVLVPSRRDTNPVNLCVSYLSSARSIAIPIVLARNLRQVRDIEIAVACARYHV